MCCTTLHFPRVNCSKPTSHPQTVNHNRNLIKCKQTFFSVSTNDCKQKTISNSYVFLRYMNNFTKSPSQSYTVGTLLLSICGCGDTTFFCLRDIWEIDGGHSVPSAGQLAGEGGGGQQCVHGQGGPPPTLTLQSVSRENWLWALGFDLWMVSLNYNQLAFELCFQVALGFSRCVTMRLSPFDL